MYRKMRAEGVEAEYHQPRHQSWNMNCTQPKTLVLKDLLRKPFPLIEDGAGNTFWIYLKKYFAKYW